MSVLEEQKPPLPIHLSITSSNLLASAFFRSISAQTCTKKILYFNLKFLQPKFDSLLLHKPQPYKEIELAVLIHISTLIVAGKC